MKSIFALALSVLILPTSGTMYGQDAALQTANASSVYNWSTFAGAGAVGTAGWSFAIGAQSISVSSLGLFGSGGDGLASSHQIGIWDSSKNLLVEITLQAGTSATLINGYRYSSIDPLTLNAGQTYSIGALYGSNSPDAIILNSSQTFAAGISYVGSRQSATSPSGSFQAPAQNAGVPQGIFGPNFQFTVVPEPGTVAFLASGAFALVWLQRRRKI